MKITKTHFEKMQAAISVLDTDTNRKAYAAMSLSLKRYQWDLVRQAGLLSFVCDELYKYADDTHIQTCLNRIVPSL